MALRTTSSLPLQLAHPRIPKAAPLPPATMDKAATDKYRDQVTLHNRELQLFRQHTQLMIDAFYNNLHRHIEGFNMVGLDADLPTPGFPGRQFTATDSKKLYKDTGSAWLSVQLT